MNKRTELPNGGARTEIERIEKNQPFWLVGRGENTNDTQKNVDPIGEGAGGNYGDDPDEGRPGGIGGCNDDGDCRSNPKEKPPVA